MTNKLKITESQFGGRKRSFMTNLLIIEHVFFAGGLSFILVWAA